MTLLARDKLNGVDVIQAVRPGGTVHQGTSSGTQVRKGPFAPTTGIVRIWAAEDIVYKQGSSTVAATATDGVPLGGKQAEHVRLAKGDHISIIQQSTGGAFFINECDIVEEV
jgi:hypothetical protein